MHPLQYPSGVYDNSSKLYFELNSCNIFDKILNKCDTDFDTYFKEINKHISN